MEKVFIVSYHFPPAGGSKTRRLLKFLKFLPQFRWTPIVLTTSARTAFGFDPSLLKAVPREVRVHRAFDISSLLRIILPSSDEERLERANPKSKHNSRLRKLAVRLCRQAISWAKTRTAIPDAYMLVWAPFAMFVGFRAIAREEPAVIYSTGPPFSNHIVGMFLKRITKKPLIVDFRDAWTANPVRRIKYTGIRHMIESTLEQIVIWSADLVVSTTEGITQDFRQRYKLERANKFITLANGYDKEEFCIAGNSARDRCQKLRIVHTGQLTLERSPKPLLAALRRLFDEKPHLSDEIEVYFVGENQAFLDGKTIENYLEEFRLESVVKLVAHVPQPEAIRYQVSADILLLVIGVVPTEQVSTYGVASKVFDYMVAGRPVLALADPGPVSEIVQRTRIGPAFAPSDVEGIKQYLSNAVEAFREGRLEVESNKSEIDRYDFRNLTGQLAEKFRTLIRE
jgi:hypothetical protein